METELFLNRGGLPPLSARGCIQELIPIKDGSFHRTINGELIYLGDPQKMKYRSLITCEDNAPFASEGLLPGQRIRMGCIQRLWQKLETLEMTLERTPVEGSVVALNLERQPIRVLEVAGKQVRVEKSEGYLSYRPWLDVCVIHFSLTTHEWEPKVSWRLEVEEI